MRLADYFRHPGYLVRRCQQILTGMYDELVAPYDVTPQQLATLHAVSEFPGVDQGRIAETIGVDRSTIGAVVERLAARGLLEASPGATDRRTKVLRLTPAGADMLDVLLPRTAELRDRFFAPLSNDEQAQLLTLLERLATSHNDASRVRQREAAVSR